MLLHTVRRFSCLFAFFFLLVAVVFASPCLAFDKEFDQTYPLEPGGSFELQNVNGTVEVEGWDRNEVQIHAVKTAKHREADLQLVSIDVDAKPTEVSVATRYPQNEGVEVVVEYRVRVPRNARVEHLGTVNGILRVSALEALADLRTVNGDIDVYGSGGSVRARTTNGNIHLELTHIEDKTGAAAETTNGSLLVLLPPNLQANLLARCLNGKFFSELPISLETAQRPREVRGKLGQGGAPIRLRTINGIIRVEALRSTV